MVWVAARRRVPVRDLALLVATATFLVLPYAFNYDLTVVMVAALAGDRPLRVGVAWTAAVVVGAVAAVVWSGSAAVPRTSLVFLATEVAGAVALAVVARGSLRLGRRQA